jgi:hypothetical protein
MKFDEVIRLQALKQKEQLSGHGGIMDRVMDNYLATTPEVPEQMRNICATISIKLFEEVENVCKTLEISKRRFVELALIEACDKAAVIVDDVNPFMSLEKGDH